MKTLISFVTFGNLDFTKLTYQSIKETVKNPYDLFLVVGKPGDEETVVFAEENNIPYVKHEVNYGFPYSVNDIYDYAWVDNDYDNLVLMGNDIIAYPGSIDSLINFAGETDYELVCANRYDVRTLCEQYPEAKNYFVGSDYIFTQFDTRPWDLFKGYSDEYIISDTSITNVQEMCLYKKSVFEKVGYTDANFYPAYYIDNDVARRCVNLNIKACTLMNSIYFHFWSRTIKQESGGSTHKFFEWNREFYRIKWGGDFTQEKWLTPFNSMDYALNGEIILKGSLKIDNRSNDQRIANYWRTK